jgi:hypothetical protein
MKFIREQRQGSRAAHLIELDHGQGYYVHCFELGEDWPSDVFEDSLQAEQWLSEWLLSDD